MKQAFLSESEEETPEPVGVDIPRLDLFNVLVGRQSWVLLQGDILGGR